MYPSRLDKRAVSLLIKDLLEKRSSLSTASRYTVLNGVIYLGAGVLLIAWPGLTQTLLMERAFVGSEQGLIRVIGLTVWSLAGFTCSVVFRAADKSSPRQ